MFKIKRTRPPAAAPGGDVDAQIIRKLAKIDITAEKGFAMLSKEVQDLIDRSRKQTDYIKSVDAGVEALQAQNEAMKAKIEEIASQPPTEGEPPADAAPGTPVTPGEATIVYSLSDEDKQALLDVTREFDDALQSLKDDIPANVEPPKAEETQPQVADPVTHQQDADASSQAQPLPGTGAPQE